MASHDYEPQDPFGANLKRFMEHLDQQEIRALSLGIGMRANSRLRRQQPTRLGRWFWRFIAHAFDVTLVLISTMLTLLICAAFFAPKVHGSLWQRVLAWQPTQLILEMKLTHFLVFTYILFFCYWAIAKLLGGITIGQVCLSIYNSALTTEKSE